MKAKTEFIECREGRCEFNESGCVRKNISIGKDGICSYFKMRQPKLTPEKKPEDIVCR